MSSPNQTPQVQPVILRGRWVIANDGTGHRVIEDSGVLVKDGQVAEIGPWKALRDANPGVEVRGSEKTAVLPGLINAHHHAIGISKLQFGVEDDVLEPWIAAGAAMRLQDPELKTLFSTYRLLRSGVTSVVDMASSRGAAETVEPEFDAVLRAYDTSGIRACVAVGVHERSFLVYGPGQDEAFLNQLPADLARDIMTHLQPKARMPAAEHLDLVAAKAEAYRDSQRMSVWFGPPGPNWVSDSLLQNMAEAAERLDTGIQTHGVESLLEKLTGPREYNTSTILHLRDLGVLGPRLSFAHGVWTTDADIEAIAESGAAVCHNPSSNLRLRSGIAPLESMRAAGMTVGLGMDATTIGDDEDMFAEMRLALRLHRSPKMADTAPYAPDIFDLATTGGARLMRREADLGRIAVGATADLVLLDLERISWPYVAPEVDPLTFIVLRARAEDVRDVLVGGETVIADGRPTRFDIEEVAKELADRVAAQPYPKEAAAAIARFAPELRKWYATWSTEGLEPRIDYNSRV